MLNKTWLQSKQLLRQIPMAREAWQHTWDASLLLRHRLRGSPVPPPHDIKLYWLRQMQRRFAATVLVETGTYYGTTVAALLDTFDQVYTIELGEMFWQKAQNRFAAYPHVHVLQGNSGEVLPAVIAGITERCIFWLDGHYSGAETARADKDTPILEELAAIRRHVRNDHVILIDDARCFTGENSYPHPTEVCLLLKEMNPSYRVRIIDDMMQAFPFRS